MCIRDRSSLNLMVVKRIPISAAVFFAHSSSFLDMVSESAVTAMLYSPSALWAIAASTALSTPPEYETRILPSSFRYADIASIFSGIVRLSVAFPDTNACLLYTSDAADEEDSVDIGGRRIIKKK